jgi:hypothetical protein
MKNKKVLIIGGAVLAAVAAFLIVKKRKSSGVATPLSDAGSDVLSGLKSAVSTGGSTSPSTPTTSEKPANAMDVKLIIKDGGRGTSNIMVLGNQPVAKGDSVMVKTDKLNGTYKVWYVYHGKSSTFGTVTNLHLEGASYGGGAAANVTANGYAVKV